MPEDRIEPPFNSRLFPVGQEHLTTDDYYTPPWVFERMAVTFDLDVAAPPGGVEWVPADRYYDQADDGLEQPWEGRVWMNPPFSECSRWVPRFMAHRDGVCILPHAKSGWHIDIWQHADACVVPDRRVNFIGHLTGGQIMYPVFLAAYGPECVAAIARLGMVRCIA